MTTKDMPPIAQLAAATERLNQQTSPAALMKATCLELTDIVGAAGCTLSRLQGEILIEVSSCWPEQDHGPFADYSYLLSDYPLTQLVLETREPRVVVIDDDAVDRGEAFVLRELNMSTVLLLPLVVQRRTWGLIEIYHAGSARFREEDPQLAGLLASHLGGLLAQFEHAAAVERLYRETFASLANTLEAKDAYTGEHTQEVVALTIDVATRFGLEGTQLRTLEWAALLHDLGKVRIPESILNKPGPLTPDEWEVVRQHPEVGARIIAPIAPLRNVIPIVRATHERWDGAGYPDGLAGEEIPLGARIVSVCDAFRAMTEDRPYRRALGTEEALRELRENAGSQFDPECVEALMSVLTEREREEESVLLHRPS